MRSHRQPFVKFVMMMKRLVRLDSSLCDINIMCAFSIFRLYSVGVFFFQLLNLLEVLKLY